MYKHESFVCYRVYTSPFIDLYILLAISAVLKNVSLTQWRLEVKHSRICLYWPESCQQLPQETWASTLDNDKCLTGDNHSLITNITVQHSSDTHFFKHVINFSSSFKPIQGKL